MTHIFNEQTKVYAKTGTTTFQAPRLDAITHAQNMISYEHHEIHDGSSFTAQYNITTADMPTGKVFHSLYYVPMSDGAYVTAIY